MKKSLNILVFSLLASVAVAGPWPQPTGGLFLKLSEWWVVADQHFTDQGKIDPNVTNGIFNTSIYAEYGIASKFTGSLYLPFFSRAYFNNTVSQTTQEVLSEGEAISSLGDAEIGLTYGLLSGPGYSISTSLKFGIPLGKTGGSEGNLQTGDGEFNQALFLEAGKSFSLGNNNGWLALGAGYNNRTKGFSDETLLSAQLGITILGGKLTPSLRVESRQSRFNGDPELALNFTSVFSNNVEYVSFTPELAYNINKNFGVSAAVGVVSSGAIIFASPSYSIGVFYKH